MAKKVGSVYAEIRADIKKLQQDFDKAHAVTQSSAKRIQNTLDKGINFNGATESLARFQKLMAVGFAGFGLQKVASSFIETAASFEVMQTKLEALEGSRGTRLFEALNKMALELPVSTEKVVQAFVTMQAMGLEPTRRQMLILSDVAAVLGDDVLGRVVLQLGQMSAKGKITAQDMNVMAEAGINVRKILAEAFGKTVEELQESGIEISKVTDAIFEGMNKKFGGSSDKMMNTWRGVTELMKSNWIEIERVVANAGVFQFLKDEIKGVSDGLKTWLDVNRETIKQDLPGYVDKVRAALAAVKGQFDALWKIITYDPAIIEFGLLGLLVGGKKGAVLAGGLAHLANIPGMLVDASILAKEGYVNVSDIVLADYKELEKIVEKGKKLKSAGPPGPLLLLPAHGTSLSPAHGEFKKTGEQLSEDADGWRKRWEDDWNVWGFKIDSSYFIKPKTEEEIEKELAKIKAAAKKALEEHKDMIESYAELANTREMGTWKDGKLEQPEFIGESGIESQRAKSYKASLDAMQKNAEDFEKNNEELWKKSVTYGEETMDQWLELTERTAAAMQDNFSNLFFDAMTGKLKTLEDYAKAVFDAIARMASDMAAQMATEALFGNLSKTGGGGGGGGLLGAILNMFGNGNTGMTTNSASSWTNWASQTGGWSQAHAGGIIGQTNFPQRSIPSHYFSTAPRLHQGLAADEYPAILQKGEKVIPKGGAKNNSTVHMHFYSQSGKYDRESVSQAQSGLYASLSRANRRNS